MWSLLVLSLPTENATARMRAWRALKAVGAAVLRDGVYLLPAREAQVATLQAVADDVRRSGGSARLLRCEGDADFESLFDRGADYASLLAQVAQMQAAAPASAAEAERARREARRLRRSFEQLRAVDYFPGTAQPQVEAALDELEAGIARALDPDEPACPSGRAAAPRRRTPAAYRGRVWATRRRPWIDRLASAWLIKRFIDPQARFLWLARPADCPPAAIGFHFDGAEFSHEGDRVTFETLLACFALESPALRRLGRLVHVLDAGGEPPPEAAGVAQVLGGMREALGDDDQLLLAAAGVFEGLHRTFEKEAAT